LCGVLAAALVGSVLSPATASGDHSLRSGADSSLAGDLDPSFGSGGVVTGNDTSSSINALAVQSDGKVVAAGYGIGGLLLARYLPDGAPDPSFGDGGAIETKVPDSGWTSAAAVALQPDGKIAVAGSADLNGNYANPVFLLARFDANGSLDASFGTGGITTTNVSEGALADALAVLPDGGILVGGWAGVDNTRVPVLARYEPDGSLDTTFGDGGIVESEPPKFPWSGIEGLAVQSDGSVVASGYAEGAADCPGTCNPIPQAMAVWRYEPNGTLDPTFHGGNPSFTNPKLRYDGGPMALQAGKIVVAGITHHHPVLERLKGNGDQDTFGTHGFAVIRSVTGKPTAVLAQSNRKLLVSVPSPPWGLAPSAIIRLLPNGRLDPSFGKGGIVRLAAAAVYALALQADQKILVGGTNGDQRYENESVLDRLLGGNNCVVPKLRGNTVSKARKKLTASYCRTGRISRLFSTRVARGHVISTATPLGDRLPDGTKVDLVVSRGKRTQRG
jgi:uncharacterized delta-60 repeat protein